ncbi:MAG: isoamylase early set domain-containing protein [Syntrophobacteraceae bacterium]
MWTRFSAVAIAALLLPFLLTHCTTSWRQQGAEGHNNLVRFIYIDSGARSVCIAGSFNGWSGQSHCMRRNGNTWTIEISLPSGRHEYAFVVDGDTWQADPGVALSEESGFGSKNSILIVE